MIATLTIMSKSESTIPSLMSHTTQKMISEHVPSWNLNPLNQEDSSPPPENTLLPPSKSILFNYYRAKDAMHPVKRLYVLDAINTLMGSHKKVAKAMVRTFWNLLDHAKQRGFDPMRLWVHGCLIGKTKRHFGVRYHAKGRGNK
jgi:hypothetical protein